MISTLRGTNPQVQVQQGEVRRVVGAVSAEFLQGAHHLDLSFRPSVSKAR